MSNGRLSRRHNTIFKWKFDKKVKIFFAGRRFFSRRERGGAEKDGDCVGSCCDAITRNLAKAGRKAAGGKMEVMAFAGGVFKNRGCAPG